MSRRDGRNIWSGYFFCDQSPPAILLFLFFVSPANSIFCFRLFLNFFCPMVIRNMLLQTPSIQNHYRLTRQPQTQVSRNALRNSAKPVTQVHQWVIRTVVEALTMRSLANWGDCSTAAAWGKVFSYAVDGGEWRALVIFPWVFSWIRVGGTKFSDGAKLRTAHVTSRCGNICEPQQNTSSNWKFTDRGVNFLLTFECFFESLFVNSKVGKVRSHTVFPAFFFFAFSGCGLSLFFFFAGPILTNERERHKRIVLVFFSLRSDVVCISTCWMNMIFTSRWPSCIAPQVFWHFFPTLFLPFLSFFQSLINYMIVYNNVVYREIWTYRRQKFWTPRTKVLGLTADWQWQWPHGSCLFQHF